jgi:hypothetical protein
VPSFSEHVVVVVAVVVVVVVFAGAVTVAVGLLETPH